MSRESFPEIVTEGSREDLTIETVREVLGTDVWLEQTGGGAAAIKAGPLDTGGQVWITGVAGCDPVPDEDGDDAWLVGVYPTDDAVASGDPVTFAESEPGATDLDALRATLRRAMGQQ